MARNDDETRTPEKLFEEWSAQPASTRWNLLRIFRVIDGRRGAWIRDLDPATLPDVRTKLAELVGPGQWDLELAKKGTNTKGPQCRVDIEMDARPPHMQGGASQALVPQGVYPGGMTMPPPYPYPFPMPQQQGPSAELVELRAQMARLEAQQGAQQQAFMQTLMRDLLLERHKAGNVMLEEQKKTFQQAFELGRSLRGGSASAADTWSSPSAVLPVLKTAADALKSAMAARAQPAQGTTPAPAAPTADPGAMVAALVKTSIEQRVPAKATIAQVRAMFGDDVLREIVERRAEFVQVFFESADTQPLLADEYAQVWFQEATAILDGLARGEASPAPATPTAPPEVLPAEGSTP